MWDPSKQLRFARKRKVPAAAERSTTRASRMIELEARLA